MAHMYSQATDLLTGNIPLPAYVDVNKILQDTADEIDSHIGFLYKTPIIVTDDGPTSRPARLLLKRISSHISSGRIMMAAASGDSEVHKYGAYLLQQGLDALNQIAAGKIALEGAPQEESDKGSTLPLIANVDEESQVEAFYDAMRRTPAPFGTTRFAGG